MVLTIVIYYCIISLVLINIFWRFKMKKIRVAALALAVIMLTLCMAACSGAEKVSVNCKISVIINDEVMLDNYAYTVQGTTENPPTILQAVREACQTVEIPCEVDSNGLSLESLTFDGQAYANGSDEENIYRWYYTVDGVEPDTGRAGNTPVQEGQTICYTYNVTPINPQQFSSGEE